MISYHKDRTNTSHLAAPPLHASLKNDLGKQGFVIQYYFNFYASGYPRYLTTKIFIFPVYAADQLIP